MKKNLTILSLLTLSLTTGFAQTEEKADTSWKQEYRATPEKKHALIHTKLEANFDIPNSQLKGNVWLTLKPHFYPSNTLVLDAKGMQIEYVALQKGATRTKLTYDYDGLLLNIKLDKTYKNNESYTVYIQYLAKPSEFKSKGSAAITDARGMYFINPKGEEKGKPTQIWTQGETEATSVWVPIIDKTNQKTTQEFYLTVPTKWVTLSNGKLISQKTNTNGTRTDYWKMDQPHSPYLFFVGAGDFAVVKDSWKGKEVNYYVDKEYASVAKKIFGLTPEMMTYFSKITGVDYPWAKYSQITGHDYVSGAMENTTATLHSDAAHQDARELVDGNNWEGTIAHELFHQWFGDYVTTESWSNLTLNESFANYSEYLWDEYKYGKDKADATNYSAMQGYLGSGSEKKDLVRYYYHDKEDMFDAVSYNKGGRILHMLRNYIGDSAFFKSINLYLTTNKYKTAEAHQLRLAFEEITGKDLNWFFNQWYFGAGHPSLDITYGYDDATKKASVIVKQTQKDKLFQLPVAIDIYNGSSKIRHQVWVKNAVDTFSFDAATKPDLINFDGDKILLAVKKENKTLEEYIHQYKHAGLYLDRREAIDFISKKQDDAKAVAFMKEALTDKYSGLRNFTLSKLDIKKPAVVEATEASVESIAKKDPSRITRSRAVEMLGNLKKPAYKALFTSLLNDSSYTLNAAALTALEKIDAAAALTEAKRLSKQPMKGNLVEAIASTLIKSGDESSFDEIIESYSKMGVTQAKFNLTSSLANFIGIIKNTEKVKRGVDEIVQFRNAIPEQFGVTPVIDNFLKTVIGKKETAKKSGEDVTALQEQIDYIKSKLKS
ncbi:M1 family peptidase [Lacibacter luteus]|uniref:M1 family peptidase n=1 Tax=Lacibacter luteus TaxID=2508719 RepID=A0A4V1M6Y8_9BACT|nr:M1 family aminopeptidase [Lacibacter luteus]RXK57386.1 M1 family peptidase [Lacibacter luteus]